MTTCYTVCGSYPGAIPYQIDTDETAGALATRLAESARCEYYAVDGITYGPFPRDGEREPGGDTRW